MMMCTRCKKRPAVVFVSPSTDMNASQGYCLVCAKEIGIKPVNDLMEKMGITEEQLEAMTDSMTSLMNMEDGDFEPGGAIPFPAELLGQFGMNAQGDGMMQERMDPAEQSTGDPKKKKENFHNKTLSNDFLGTPTAPRLAGEIFTATILLILVISLEDCSTKSPVRPWPRLHFLLRLQLILVDVR